MEIKISLKQLNDLFAQSASNEKLPPAVRQFAAQLTVLTVHVARVDAKLNAYAKQTDKHIADVAGAISVVNSRIPSAGAPANAEISVPEGISEEIASMAVGPSGDADGGLSVAPMSIEDEAASVKEKMEQEALEEAAALQAKYASAPPPVAIIPKNGSGKTPPAGAA